MNLCLKEKIMYTYTTNWKYYTKKITKAIREVDTNHIITIEGANWATDFSIFSEPFDSNILYQFHK